MKIAFLIKQSGVSGGLFVVLEHAHRLTLAGHETVIVCVEGRSSLDFSHYPCGGSVPGRYLKDIGPTESFDVAFATWWETAYTIHRLRARHYAYFVQGFEADYYARPLRTNRLLVEKTLDEDFHFFAVSRRLRRMVQAHGHDATVIPNGIDLALFNGTAAYPRGNRLRVLVEGTGSVAYKRIGLAFSVLEEFPDVEVFCVAGDGYREPAWRIDRFFQRVPYADMPGIHASCDILLKLSSTETFAMPVLEMFASGGTAVVTAFPGHDEYIQDGGNALVVPIDDRAAAVAALRRLVTDPALRDRLRAGARATAARHSWDASAAIFLSALRKLADEPGLGEGQLTKLPPCRDAYEDYLELQVQLRDARIALGDHLNSTSYRIGRWLTAPLRRLHRGAAS